MAPSEVSDECPVGKAVRKGFLFGFYCTPRGCKRKSPGPKRPGCQRMGILRSAHDARRELRRPDGVRRFHGLATFRLRRASRRGGFDLARRKHQILAFPAKAQASVFLVPAAADQGAE